MVTELFREESMAAVGERFRSQGRLLPDGVAYVDSWMAADGMCCFQIMDAPSLDALQVWIGRWNDLVEFEVCPIVRSADYWSGR